MEIWTYNQFTDQREVLKIAQETDICIGREETNAVVLRSPFVSRRHARIIHENGGYFVESLGLNGVLVANRQVPKGEKRKIDYGDEIRIGEYSLYMMEPTQRRIAAADRTVSPRK